MRPRLAVAAVLAAVGVAAGGYYLWPKGRSLSPCTPTGALAAYAGRIRHDVERTSEDARRAETWYDALTGAQREVSFDAEGRVVREIGTIRRRTSRSIWVAPEERTWYSTRDPVWQLAQPDALPVVARTYREKVARGRARALGRERIEGHEVLQLHETVKPLRAVLPGAAAPLRPSQPLEIDTWVDPLTYVPVRTRSELEGSWTQVDSTWLPRTPANVAKTRVVVPRGFGRIHPSSPGASEKVLARRVDPCAQS